jgi:hypothetical protein
MLTLEQARTNIIETEKSLRVVDRVLDLGEIHPKNDLEVATAIGITIDQLGKVREYIITGRISLGLGNCKVCRGWGGWDDIPCGACKGSGNSSERSEECATSSPEVSQTERNS